MTDNIHKIRPGYPFDQGARILQAGFGARLGYDIAKLADDPKSRELIKLSERSGKGVGIDSDLPKPFYLPKGFDYHNLSAFGFDDLHVLDTNITENKGFLPIVQVLYLFDDGSIKTFKGDWIKELKFQYMGPGGEDLRAMILMNHTRGMEAQYKIDAISSTAKKKIEGWYSEDNYRQEAIQYTRLVLESAVEKLDKFTESILEEIDDMQNGKRIRGSAQPVIDEMKCLFDLYRKQMS